MIFPVLPWNTKKTKIVRIVSEFFEQVELASPTASTGPQGQIMFCDIAAPNVDTNPLVISTVARYHSRTVIFRVYIGKFGK